MDASTARARLEAERQRLEETRRAAPDLVTDSGVLQRVNGELEEVDAALGRLDAGTYGICALCGQPVGDGRLEAKPAARYCVNDQARAEREGRVGAGITF